MGRLCYSLWNYLLRLATFPLAATTALRATREEQVILKTLVLLLQMDAFIVRNYGQLLNPAAILRHNSPWLRPSSGPSRKR